jgi:negative regulator of sigma E activity
VNDLELISAFRSDLGEPDEAETARARAALMHAIAGDQAAPRARRRPARRRWLLTASAVTVTAAVLLAASASLTGETTAPSRARRPPRSTGWQ